MNVCALDIASSRQLLIQLQKSSIGNQATPMDTLSQLGMITTPEVGFYLTRTESESELVFGSPHDKYVKNKRPEGLMLSSCSVLMPTKAKKLLFPNQPRVTVYIVLSWMASFLMDTWYKVQTTSSVWRKLRSSLILGRL